MTYRPAVANRPTNHAPSVASGSYFQGEDLRRVKPRYGQPRRSENGSEEKHEEDGGASYAGSGFVAVLSVDRGASKTTGAEHADTLAD